MAYPSGSGSERLHRGAIHNLVNAWTSFRFEGLHPATGTATYAVPANHIVTILSIIVTEMAGATHKINITGTFLGSTSICFVDVEPVPTKQTFVWNEKIVLHPTDKLQVVGDAGSNFDIYYTYVEQDWS